MKIGLFFGSFNPIHIGHLIIADYMATQSDLERVWFVVSPQNPFKKKTTLANDYQRLHLVRMAVQDNPNLEASKIEFGLPQPSYTIDTLAHLREQHPEHEFSLIMGGDNLVQLHKWKNYEQILKYYSIYVYRRPGADTDVELANHPSVTLLDAPLMELSASEVRRRIKAGLSTRYILPDAVREEIDKSGLYR